MQSEQSNVELPGRLFAIAACLIATYLLFAVTAMRVALRVREVPVPSCAITPWLEATAQLQEAGLALTVDQSGVWIRSSRRPHRAAGARGRRRHPPPAQRPRVGEPGAENYDDSHVDRRVRARRPAAAAAGRTGRDVTRRSAIVRLPERHDHRAGAARQRARYRGRAARQSRRAQATIT
jgi:hypothetical protein